MENRQVSKTIKLGDRTFEINKLDARSSCWLFSTMAEKAEGRNLLMALGKYSRLDYQEIETLVLKKVYFLDDKDGQTFPTPILGANGQVSLPLEADELYRLMCESLMFSLSPFLQESQSSLQRQKDQSGT